MEYDDQEAPKLMLFADLRLSSPENPGRMTPPLHSMATVPFRWEERPGKAIVAGDITNNELAVSKSLELPPRLLSLISSAGKSSSKVIKLMPSPDTVLVDSPFITSNANEGASFRFLADGNLDDQEYCKGRSLLWSLSRGRSISRRRSLSFSNPDCSNSKAAATAAPLDKIKRGRNLVSIPQNHFWERFCGGLKQLIMPWSRKQEKNGEL